MSKANLGSCIGASPLFWLVVLTGAVVFVYDSGTTSRAAAPAATKWSDLISAADLQSEAQDAAERLAADTATAASYKQNGESIAHTAYLLAIWANIAVEHDGPLPFKGNAATIRDKALAIAKTKTHSAAKSTADEVKSLVQGGASAGGSPSAAMKWSELCELDQVMEEVNPRSTALRRAVRPASFKKMAKQAARDAAVLAALAQVAQHHTEKAEGEKKVDEWNKLSTDLRTAAIELSKAAAASNASGAKAAQSKVLKACNECHEVFRIDTE